AAEPTATNAPTSNGPTKYTVSDMVVSAPSASERRCAKAVPGPVTDVQAPRMATDSGGYVAPASADTTQITAIGAPAETPTTNPISTTGWTTAVSRRTGPGPIRSAARDTTGLATAPASAYAPAATAAG